MDWWQRNEGSGIYTGREQGLYFELCDSELRSACSNYHLLSTGGTGSICFQCVAAPEKSVRTCYGMWLWNGLSDEPCGKHSDKYGHPSDGMDISSVPVRRRKQYRIMLCPGWHCVEHLSL